MDKPEYRSVGKSVRKKDSLQLLLGKPVYTEDIAPDALVVKLLRSPHANAMVKDCFGKARHDTAPGGQAWSTPW